MIEPIITGAFLALMGVAALCGFLSGMHKKWQYTLVKIASTALATVVAIFVARVIPTKGMDYITNSIVGGVPENIAADVESILTAPAVEEPMTALISMLLAPLLFSLAFIAVKLVLALAVAPIARFWINKAEDNKVWNYNSSNYDKWGKKKLLEHKQFRMSSALLGAFSGVLVVYMLSIPVVFGISMTGTIAEPIVDNFLSEDTTIVEICDASIDNRAVTAMELTGGKAIYDSITASTINGQTAHLSDEINFWATCIKAIVDISNADGYDGAVAKNSINEMAAAFDKATITPSIISGIISVADAKWSNGDTFLGINQPSLPEPFTPISDAIFDILKGDDIDELKNDLGSLFRVTGILCEEIKISEIADDPLSLLTNKEVTAKLFEELYSSDRLYTLVPALAECGIGVMADTLSFNEDVSATYMNMVNEILAATQNAASDDELATKLRGIFNSYGIDAKAESCEALATTLIENNADGTMTAETVIEILSEVELVIVEADEETISIVNLTADVYAEKTQLVFTENIAINYDKPANIKTEADMLAFAFATVGDIANKTAGTDFDTKSMITDFGTLIDCFSDTHTFGDAASENLLMCVLQSDTVTDTLKTDVLQITHLGKNIVDTAQEESYSAILDNVVTTLSIIEGASNNEDITGQIEDLIMNMTPGTANTLQQFITTENIESLGVPSQSAGQTSDLISNIFGNLSDAKTSGELSEEEYKAEAEAVSGLINFAMGATSNSGSSDSVFTEDKTVSDLVDSIADSKVMGQTVIDAVYDENGNKTVDPLNTSVTLNNSEKTELLAAMNNNLANADAADKEETQKTLTAIAALVNVEVVVVNGEFVIPGFSN